jgi:hypothetical protein
VPTSGRTPDNVAADVLGLVSGVRP